MSCNEHGCSCCSHKEHTHSSSVEACGCGHEHEHSTVGKTALFLTASGAILIVLSFLPFLSSIKDWLLIAATLLCGFSTFKNAFHSLKKLRIDESLLLLIAVVAAVILKEFFEAAMVSVLFRLGALLEEYASGKSRKAIESVFSIVSDEANLVLPDGKIHKVDADDLEINARIAVFPHEIIPVDGVVYDGAGTVDASAITGESIPVSVCKGDSVLSGMLNGESVIYLEVTALKNQSSAARIAEMVETAAAQKGHAQRAVATFAKYYTPIIVIVAVLFAVIPSLITGNWSEWIYRSLILLVASCPCAVVLSAPLAFFSSMGAAAKNGMIIKGSGFIESLAKADTAVFDKTGTLTTGELHVGRVYTVDGISAEKALELAAMCEQHSSHPIARAIVVAANNSEIPEAEDYKEIPGGGTSVRIVEGILLCAGERLMAENGIDISAMPKTPVYIALNNEVLAAFEIDGEIRSDSASTIQKLRKLGVENMVMLTGDSAEQARKVSSACSIDVFESNLLPEDKLAHFEEIKSKSNGVIYVGDGVNDAPVLAASDVGVAMGLGTQAACEAADVILTNSDFSRLADAVYLSKRTMKVLKFNIGFAIAVKVAVIVLGILGIAPMSAAIFADVGTMIIAVLNAAKLLKIKRY